MSKRRIVKQVYCCALRSLKTLKIRMEEHQKNALIVGQWLEKHPCVVSVRHPGLPSHPQHELVKRQCYGHSGMMSFYIKGGLQESKDFLSALKVMSTLFSVLSQTTSRSSLWRSHSAGTRVWPSSPT